MKFTYNHSFIISPKEQDRVVELAKIEEILLRRQIKMYILNAWVNNLDFVGHLDICEF